MSSDRRPEGAKKRQRSVRPEPADLKSAPAAADLQSVYDAAVLGAGASGLAASYSYLRRCIEGRGERSGPGKKLLIIDSNGAPGKKLSVTGNGRCNLLPESFDAKNYFGDAAAYPRLLSPGRLEQCVRVFEHELGVPLVAEDGRLYPLSNRAESVVTALYSAVRAMGAFFCLGSRVVGISKHGDDYELLTEGENGALSIKARSVIFAFGGRSYPEKGSDGSGFGLLGDLGVRVTPTYPSLTAVEVEKPIKAMDGVRAKAAVSAYVSGEKVCGFSGEVQFTSYGLSGVCVMQLSRYITRSVTEGRSVTVKVCLLPGDCAEKARNILFSENLPDVSVVDRLTGLVPKKTAVSFIKLAGIDPDARILSLPEGKKELLMKYMTGLEYLVKDLRGYDYAQITAGGVPVSEVDASTMELKRLGNCYICGEACNVDALCGGNNLFWAFSSGFAAGEAAYEARRGLHSS
ncbi:MAG: aminoacetone oxidase family FAD-binding enzyme [Clostridia bacterium]|nr:aminoacetone oxidase family FAD-binding enzyme [Clostridia bacterium]